jgi:hypothetical protein
MHPWRLWFASGLLASFAAGAAVVYKWTDAAGVVHFSDQPVPGAEKIVTSSGSSNGIGGRTGDAAPPSRAGPAGPQKAAGAMDYSDLAIDSPTKEQVFFGDDSVPVHLHLTPGLQQNHAVTWQLNGRTLDDQANAVSFTLSSLPRGTYSVGATVSDPATGQSRSAESITFYVRQPSELAPQHKKN